MFRFIQKWNAKKEIITGLNLFGEKSVFSFWMSENLTQPRQIQTAAVSLRSQQLLNQSLVLFDVVATLIGFPNIKAQDSDLHTWAELTWRSVTTWPSVHLTIKGPYMMFPLTWRLFCFHPRSRCGSNTFTSTRAHTRLTHRERWGKDR